jgi:hypothetical protein
MRVANVCRRSWKRITGTAASRQACWKGLETLCGCAKTRSSSLVQFVRRYQASSSPTRRSASAPSGGWRDRTCRRWSTRRARTCAGPGCAGRPSRRRANAAQRARSDAGRSSPRCGSGREAPARARQAVEAERSAAAATERRRLAIDDLVGDRRITASICSSERKCRSGSTSPLRRRFGRAARRATLVRAQPRSTACSHTAPTKSMLWRRSRPDARCRVHAKASVATGLAACAGR